MNRASFLLGLVLVFSVALFACANTGTIPMSVGFSDLAVFHEALQDADFAVLNELRIHAASLRGFAPLLGLIEQKLEAQSDGFTSMTTMALSHDSFLNADDDFSTAATIPAGTCRNYSTSELVCATIIADGTSIWLADGATAESQALSITSMASLLGAASPFTDCDLTLYTALCNMVYAPCVEIPVSATATAAIPLLPCNDTWLPLVEEHCPIFVEMGLLPTISSLLVFSNPPTCNAALTAVAPRTIDYQTALGITTIATLPPFDCPAPLVLVDPFTYKHDTILSGSCAMPCPNPVFSRKQYDEIDNFNHGWAHLSEICLIVMTLSYIVLPALRRRTFFLVFAICLFMGSWLTYFPWLKQVAQHKSGAATLCNGPAEDIHWNAPLCFFGGILFQFSLFGGLCACNGLGIDLFIRMVLNIKLTRKQHLIKNSISVFLCFLVPLVMAFVALGYHQFDGWGLGMTVCQIAKNRDNPHGPDLADIITIYLSLVLVVGAYVEFFSVFAALIIRAVRSGVESWRMVAAQIRVLILLVVMSTFFIGLYGFRLDLSVRMNTPIHENTSKWVLCLFLEGGTAACGEHPVQPEGFFKWRKYVGWIQIGTGVPAAVITLSTIDFIWGWGSLLYVLTKLNIFKHCHEQEQEELERHRRHEKQEEQEALGLAESPANSSVELQNKRNPAELDKSSSGTAIDASDTPPALENFY